MRAREPAGFQLPKVAVIYPTYAESLLASARDLTLSAHAEGLTLGLKRSGFCARAYTTGTVSNGLVRSVGPMWSLQTLRELLHELQMFAPDVIIVEHAPLAFGRELFVPATIAMWARSHRIELCTISHPEPGGRSGIRNERVSAAMRTCGALFAHSFAIVTHDAEWAQQLRQFLPEASDAIDVQGAWPLIEPAFSDENALAAAAAKPYVPKAMASMKFPEALKKNEASRVKLSLVLDGVLPLALERILANVERLPPAVDVTLLAPFSAPAVVQRYEAILRQLEGGSSLSLLGDELTIRRFGRTLSLAQPATRTELSKLLLASDAVIELPPRHQPSDVWNETARAHGNVHFRMGSDDTFDTIADVAHADAVTRIGRIRNQIYESSWRGIAKRIGQEIHLGAQPIEPDLDLFSAAEERIEEPPIAIRESA
jgi:hypothetical protein